MNPVILAVYRDDRFIEGMVGRLTARNIACIQSAPGEPAVSAVVRQQPNLVVVDSGADADDRVLDGIRRIRCRHADIPIFLIARCSSEALAIGALKAGVDDYFKAPFSMDDLLEKIEGKLSTDEDIPAGHSRAFARMVGSSRVMNDLKSLLRRVAMADSTVLITGETGTGKELAANLIHENSARARKPMVGVNSAALPDNLVESELFGYERGAFTGAVATTRGRFELAHGGTIFLDEIGDMTPFTQAKILRAIEDKQVARLGGATPIALNFRLIAATNRDPETLIQEGAFRNDLFYRLNVARVHMPSLREHCGDIPELVAHGIRRLNRQFHRQIKGLREDVVNLLMRYDWPGNVRELMNVLEGAYINLPARQIDYADLPAHFKKKLSDSRKLPADERRRILTALLETNWNKSSAAKKLNWSRMTLYRKMSKHSIVERRRSRQPL
jgi:DNA-binding NtrC family response regulator